MEFRKQFVYVPSGEILSDELVTEPGQSFTTREIYERFIRTGRVEGMARPIVYDSDSLGHEPGFDDWDGTQDPTFTKMDAIDQLRELRARNQKREALHSLAQEYKAGKTAYADFVRMARKVDYDLAQPYVDAFKPIQSAKTETASTSE